MTADVHTDDAGDSDSLTLDRLSLNQITMDRMAMQDAIDACARAGLTWIGLWRHKVQEAGLETTRRLLRDAGVRVSSLCRAGFFAAPSATEREARLKDNLRAVEEAAELDAETLVLVCGPAPGRDLHGARQMVREGIAELVPHAAAFGVRLGVEPLHPMYAAERSVIVTLEEALDIVLPFDPSVIGVIVDAFHVWWDPKLYDEIGRAQGRILGFHVSDWLVPLPDMLMGRGFMGDGVIDLRRMRRAVDETGYRGPIEVEIFNEEVWALPGDESLTRICDRYRRYV